MSKIKITYEIEDGYVGPARPQTFYAHSSDFDDCERDDQIADRIDELAHEHAVDNLTTNALDASVTVAAILAARKAQAA
jgi:hypothetical protein